jgi:hypothetical protein
MLAPIPARVYIQSIEANNPERDEMTLAQAVAKKATLRANGVKCQNKYIGDGIWTVAIQGVDY